jgi:hypothetical protein
VAFEPAVGGVVAVIRRDKWSPPAFTDPRDMSQAAATPAGVAVLVGTAYAGVVARPTSNVAIAARPSIMVVLPEQAVCLLDA